MHCDNCNSSDIVRIKCKLICNNCGYPFICCADSLLEQGMINPPVVGQTFVAKNGNIYNIDVIFPPLTDEDGGVFRIVSIGYNAYLGTGNQVVTNIRKNVNGNWEEMKTDIPGQQHPTASN